jgi:hypothetical protein
VPTLRFRSQRYHKDLLRRIAHAGVSNAADKLSRNVRLTTLLSSAACACSMYVIYVKMPASACALVRVWEYMVRGLRLTSAVAKKALPKGVLEFYYGVGLSAPRAEQTCRTIARNSSERGVLALQDEGEVHPVALKQTRSSGQRSLPAENLHKARWGAVIAWRRC